jgi:hypothetical protein
MSEGVASHDQQPGIARSVGQAIGIVWQAIRTPVAAPAVEVSRRSETVQQGGVTLRRTTIDEVVVDQPHRMNPTN